jgi:cytochrome c
MMRIQTISALTLAISTGAALAQDVAMGETSFRKCQLCHDVGGNAKNKLGPELDGLNGRKAGAVENFNYSEGSRTPASLGRRTHSRSSSRTRAAKFLARACFSRGSKTRRSSAICGLMSSSSDPMERRNKPRASYSASDLES